MRRRYERLVDSIASQASFQATPPRAEFLHYLRTSSRPGAPPPPPIDVGLTTSSTDTDFSPPELSARQYALMLLHVASQIEHALMVQYLYAAYSLGGTQIASPEHRALAEEWRTVLIGIAKEEMGHLLTVQNVIRFLGGAPSLERDDYPVHSPFHAFDFQLEPLTKTSLARYIVAESPEKGVDPGIVALAKQGNQGQPVNRVGNLHAMLRRLFLSKEAHAFSPPKAPSSALRYQATWDEWGRGHRDGERGKPANRVRDGATASASSKDGPDLLILEVDSVQKAVEAIEAIAEQGESPQDISTGKSHFTRLSEIFDRFPKHDEWQPSRPTGRNPSTSRWVPTETDVSAGPASAGSAAPGSGGPQAASEPPVSWITDPISRTWAHLFNVRYRMTLFGIGHALQLPQAHQAAVRGQVIARLFGEMYQMRAMADVLVDLPLTTTPGDPRRAGPPFEMPYTLTLPDTEPARWRSYEDFIDASNELVGVLRSQPTTHDDYLRALQRSDALYLETVREFIARV